ncbi:hypothetical protein AHAS_Ahas20G0210300 [Arachis hypogaea]
MEPPSFRLRFLAIRNSNKKSNSVKVFVSFSSTRWHHFCLVKFDGNVTSHLLEFGQLEF